jgi:hypothetical protein
MMFLFQSNLSANSPVLPTSVGVAVISAYVLHLAKCAKSLPKINFYSTKLNAIIRAGMSGIGTIGISLSWAAAASGGGTVSIAIPSLGVLLAGLWHWAVQFGIQHFSEGALQMMRQMALIAKESAEAAEQGAAQS